MSKSKLIIMGTSQSGAQSIRYNRSLLSKRNTFKDINSMLISENNNKKIKGLSKSENKKVRTALDKERLTSENDKKLAYFIAAIIGMSSLTIMIKAIEALFF